MINPIRERLGRFWLGGGLWLVGVCVRSLLRGRVRRESIAIEWARRMEMDVASRSVGCWAQIIDSEC
jgi:hypothetical protein